MFAFQIANSITASQVFAVEWMRERFKESKKKKQVFSKHLERKGMLR